MISWPGSSQPWLEIPAILRNRPSDWRPQNASQNRGLRGRRTERRQSAYQGALENIFDDADVDIGGRNLDASIEVPSTTT